MSEQPTCRSRGNCILSLGDFAEAPSVITWHLAHNEHPEAGERAQLRVWEASIYSTAGWASCLGV